MSIASELNRLLQAKSDLATSIENKGVTVPSATTIDGYAALVDQIQQGTPLPYDAEVTYLESTGTQFINSGVNATATLTTEIKFSLVSGFTLGNTSFLFGIYNDSPSRYSVAIPSLSSLRVGTSTGFTNVTCPTMSYGVANTLSYKFGSIKFNSSQIGTTSGVINTTMSIYLFGRHNANTTGEVTNKIRIYGATFTDNNNIIIRDLIPVRVGQVGYMYDRISGALFGNAGTGNFTLGPDVT